MFYLNLNAHHFLSIMNFCVKMLNFLTHFVNQVFLNKKRIGPVLLCATEIKPQNLKKLN